MCAGNCFLLDCDDEGKTAQPERSPQGIEHNGWLR